MKVSIEIDAELHQTADGRTTSREVPLSVTLIPGTERVRLQVTPGYYVTVDSGKLYHAAGVALDTARRHGDR